MTMRERGGERERERERERELISAPVEDFQEEDEEDFLFTGEVVDGYYASRLDLQKSGIEPPYTFQSPA